MELLIIVLAAVVTWSLFGLVAMSGIFGAAAIVNSGGDELGKARKAISRALKVAAVNTILSSIVLLVVYSSYRDIFEKWFLLIPILINVYCVRLIFGSSKNA